MAYRTTASTAFGETTTSSPICRGRSRSRRTQILGRVLGYHRTLSEAAPDRALVLCCDEKNCWGYRWALAHPYVRRGRAPRPYWRLARSRDAGVPWSEFWARKRDLTLVYLERWKREIGGDERQNSSRVLLIRACQINGRQFPSGGKAVPNFFDRNDLFIEKRFGVHAATAFRLSWCPCFGKSHLTIWFC